MPHMDNNPKIELKGEGKRREREREIYIPGGHGETFLVAAAVAPATLVEADSSSLSRS